MNLSEKRNLDNKAHPFGQHNSVKSNKARTNSSDLVSSGGATPEFLGGQTQKVNI